MSPESRPKTVFTTPFGLYQFNVMPFGLQGAPATFQRMMDQLLKGLEDFAAAYLDDLVIYSSSWGEHLDLIRQVMDRLRGAGLTAKPRKAITSFQQPKMKKEVRAFLGLTGYYRRFIPDFATIAVSLSDLVRKNSPNQVVWSHTCEQAFTSLKKLCVHPQFCGVQIFQSHSFFRRMLLTMVLEQS